MKTERRSVQNPVTRLREESGLDRKSFSVLVGLNYYTLYQNELGYQKTLSYEMTARLAKYAKTTPEAIQMEYQQWREVLRHNIATAAQEVQQ